jgi:mycothiol system anti-sigma-R factor
VIGVILLGIVSGLLANELCDFSPWCARKLVRWSAFRRYADPGRAELRAEELTAVINNRPDNLFRLITAAVFAIAAVVVYARRAVARDSDAATGSAPAIPPGEGGLHAYALARIHLYLDGDADERTCAKIRRHLDECGYCLRELGLEEAVKRLVEKRGGGDPQLERAYVVARIREIRSTIE